MKADRLEWSLKTAGFQQVQRRTHQIRGARHRGHSVLLRNFSFHPNPSPPPISINLNLTSFLRGEETGTVFQLVSLAAQKSFTFQKAPELKVEKMRLASSLFPFTILPDSRARNYSNFLHDFIQEKKSCLPRTLWGLNLEP